MKLPSRQRIYQVLHRLSGKGDPLFVENLNGGFDYLPSKALLYYVTTPFFMPKSSDLYAHTNLWEVTEIVRLLNINGFSVDVIDRGAKDFAPENNYDLFIGLGAGRSGKYFAKYASSLTRAVKVLLAAGPEPVLSNKLVSRQYEFFNSRHNSNVPPMRLTEGIDFDNFLSFTDYLLVIGEKGQFCHSTYELLGKPVLNYMPGISPNVRFLPEWFKTRQRNRFVCFAGNGFICKGVDLLVEAFLELPDLYLHICGPDNETGFFDVLGEKITNSHNITYEGFVSVGGQRFEQLCSECSYVIFHSSSEGCATSVATLMRAGLVPVLNTESGINIAHFGYELKSPLENSIENIKKVCETTSNISDDIYTQRVWATVRDSQKYSQCSFTETVSEALQTILCTAQLN